MRRIVISCLVFFTVFLHLSCRGTRSGDPPENDEREEGGQAAAGRERERDFYKLLGEGEALLKVAVMMERREMEILKKETDSPELRKTLQAQRAALQQAVGCYKQALIIHPNSFKAHQGVAIAAAKLGRYDEAIEHGTIVLEGSRERAGIYSVLVPVYVRKAEQTPGPAGAEYMRKASELMERYAHLEKPPMLHYMKHFQAIIYVKRARRLSGAARAAEYDKAMSLLETHLAAYPELRTGKDEFLLQWGIQMETMLEQLKMIKRRTG